MVVKTEKEIVTPNRLYTSLPARGGTGSVTLTRDPTRPGMQVTRDPD